VLRKPSVNPRFRLRTLDAERVLLSHETGFRVLHGRLPALLVPLIEGRRTPADLAGALDGAASPIEVWFGLSLLEEEGCLEEPDADEPAGIAAFRSVWGVSRHVLARRRSTTAITLSAIGSLSVDPLASLLESLGVQLGPHGDLAVVLTDDYLRDELDETDRHQRARGRPWLPVKPVGSVVWFGPLLTPGARPCWRCVRDRLSANRPEQTWLERHGVGRTTASACRPSIAGLPSTYQTAIGIAATQILRWIARRTAHPLADCLMTFDLNSIVAERHHVVPMAGCRTCNGAARPGAPRRITVHHGAALSRDNGYRVVAPEDTIARLRPLVSAITGIIGGLECRTGDDSLVHFYVADHVFEPALWQPGADWTGFRHLSAGKGMTATQAQASALCEAVERYSGVFRGGEALVHGRLHEVQGAIHPNRCLNFSARQYRSRRNDAAPYAWVPEPFDERMVIDWAPAWSLTARTWRHLPAAHCYYGYRDRGRREYCRADSNGCAAGNTREEAILQGFLELVERDAVAMWWYNRVRRPGVSLETFPGTYFDLLVRHYHRLRRTVQVLDLTNDFGLPTFVALSRQVAPRRPDLIAGAGTHFDATVAVGRALTEMNQFLPAALSGRLEPTLRAPRRDSRFLEPDPRLAARRFEDFPEPPADDVGALVRRCVRIAARRGLETLVLDQTRLDVGLPVVRVVVPGLRHFYPRLGPGRLYDVPVTLGWLDRPRPEGAMNPVPFFL
jgi:ribosomal protein S12 methylthiotransferase accessory factor